MTVFTTRTKVQTRDGRKARILAIDCANKDYPIVALVTNDDGAEHVNIYTRNGAFYDRTFSARPDGSDLVPAPVVTERFHNVYAGSFDSNVTIVRGTYGTRESAIHGGGHAPRRLAVIKTTVENGKLVDVSIVPDLDL